MAENEIWNEIEDIKARLKKVEQHVESCEAHEGEAGHGRKHRKMEHEHGKAH